MAEEEYTVEELLLDGARYGDEEDVRNALDSGVDTNTAGPSGATGKLRCGKGTPACLWDMMAPALHMAAANGHADVLQILLQAGANVAAVNEEGNTPLHWAAMNRQCQAVRLLLAAGASPSAVNKQEETPVDEALRRGFDDVMEIIRGQSTPELDVTGSKDVDEFDEAGEEQQGSGSGDAPLPQA